MFVPKAAGSLPVIISVALTTGCGYLVDGQPTKEARPVEVRQTIIQFLNDVNDGFGGSGKLSDVDIDYACGGSGSQDLDKKDPLGVVSSPYEMRLSLTVPVANPSDAPAVVGRAANHLRNLSWKVTEENESVGPGGIKLMSFDTPKDGYGGTASIRGNNNSVIVVGIGSPCLRYPGVN